MKVMFCGYETQTLKQFEQDFTTIPTEDLIELVNWLEDSTKLAKQLSKNEGLQLIFICSGLENIYERMGMLALVYAGICNRGDAEFKSFCKALENTTITLDSATSLEAIPRQPKRYKPSKKCKKYAELYARSLFLLSIINEESRLFALHRLSFVSKETLEQGAKLAHAWLKEHQQDKPEYKALFDKVLKHFC